jgi:hypothetical protein
MEVLSCAVVERPTDDIVWPARLVVVKNSAVVKRSRPTGDDDG